MAKRTSIKLSDADEQAIQVVIARYGQQSEAGVIRLCLHMVAQAKEIVLESSAINAKTGKQGSKRAS
jgi:hypothetical protein